MLTKVLFRGLRLDAPGSYRLAKVRRPPGVRELNEMHRKAEAIALGYETKLAKALVPILERAGRQAASNFRDHATDHTAAVTASLLAAGRPDSVGMVAFYPRPEEAAALAREGTDPSELHVTLLYLSDSDVAIDPHTLAEAVRAAAARFRPIEGEVGGIGAFRADGTPPFPSVLLPDVKGMFKFRHEVAEELAEAGYRENTQHGWIPHITVAYTDEPEPPSEELLGLPLHFDSVTFAWGEDKARTYPLGPAALVAAGEWSPPHRDEVLDVEALVASLRGKLDPVRLAVAEQMMTGPLHGVGLSFDVTNPMVQGMLSSQKITAIADTTRADVMRIIQASYEAGLSIPSTATAIQAGMSEAAEWRATMIARTEMTAITNAGSLAATQIVSDATGDTYLKVWLTAPGAEFPRHEEYDDLDGQTRALDELFDVGGFPADAPGDEGLPPEESINCRCTMEYVTPAEAEEQAAEEGEGGALFGPGGGGGEEVAAEEGFGGEEALSVEEAPLPEWDGGVTDGEATLALDEMFQDWGASLTSQQFDGLKAYRKEQGFQAINTYLREGKTPVEGYDKARVEGLVRGIDSAIGTSPAVPAMDMTVWRGVSDLRATLGKDVRAGSRISERGFVSATTEEDAALDYTGYQPKSGLIKIQVPEGTQGAWMRARDDLEKPGHSYSGTDFPVHGGVDNFEYVLARNQTYEVVSVGREHGFPVVELRIVPKVEAARPIPPLPAHVDREELRRLIKEYNKTGEVSRNAGQAIRDLTGMPAGTAIRALKAEEAALAPTTATSVAEVRAMVSGALKVDLDEIRGRAEWITQAEAGLRFDRVGPDEGRRYYRAGGRSAPYQQEQIDALVAAGERIEREMVVPMDTADAVERAARYGEEIVAQREAAIKPLREELGKAEQERFRAEGVAMDRIAQERYGRSRYDLNYDEENIVVIKAAEDPEVMRLLEIERMAREAHVKEYDLWTERLKAARTAEAEARAAPVIAQRAEAMRVLSELRPMGPKGSTTLHFGDAKGRGYLKARKLLTSAQEFFPTAWIERWRTIETSTGARGSHGTRYGGAHIKVDNRGTSKVPGDEKGLPTAIHELGHEVEDTNTLVVQLQAAFYDKRTRGGDWDGVQEPSQRMQVLRRGWGYRADEIAREDKFSDPYMGKVYPGGRNYELLTMGLEGLWTGSEALDDEYRRFILGLLALI